MSEIVQDWEKAEAILARDLQNAQREIERLEAELQIAKSDKEMLKETIVLLAMRQEGVK